MKTWNCVLLRRLYQSGELKYTELVKGLYYSDEQTILDKLLDYRERRLVEFVGDLITGSTVIRMRRRNRRGRDGRKAGNQLHSVR